jgi:CheY-like chemotaxis protein
MSEEIIVALIQLIPPILWVSVILCGLLLFYNPIRANLIPRLTEFKAFGIEASFIKGALDRAAKKVPAGDEQSRGAVARRAERSAEIIAGARILLVNDVPEEMSNVIEILKSLKVVVDISTDTEAALALLKRVHFDAVVSDMNRAGVPNEGILFLNRAIELHINRPTIFTVGQYDPDRGTPAHAFAITNRVDDLLHYIFDVLERSRG